MHTLSSNHLISIFYTELLILYTEIFRGMKSIVSSFYSMPCLFYLFKSLSAKKKKKLSSMKFIYLFIYLLR